MDFDNPTPRTIFNRHQSRFDCFTPVEHCKAITGCIQTKEEGEPDVGYTTYEVAD